MYVPSIMKGQVRGWRHMQWYNLLQRFRDTNISLASYKFVQMMTALYMHRMKHSIQDKIDVGSL